MSGTSPASRPDELYTAAMAITKKLLIMKKYYLFAGLILLAASPAFAQVKIGAPGAPDGSAMLEVTSGPAGNKGMLLPRMTTVQRNAITSPATGLMIYNTTANEVQVNTGTPALPTWVTATATATGWNLSGNTGTAPATNFIGTTDNQPLAIRTNNTEQMRVTATGSVGIGTSAPAAKLQVVDTGDVAILVGNAAGSRGHIRLGNDNHGIMRDLTSSGGEANDVAVYTSTGNAAGSSLYLVSNPISTGSDSLPLNQFVLKNTGNVGIGTNNPAVKLQIVDTGDVTLRIGNTTGIGSRGHIQLGNDNHGVMRDLTGSGGLANDVALFTSSGGSAASLYLVANPTATGSTNLPLNQFVLTAAGNVGIGTGIPAQTLHVAGTARITGSAGTATTITGRNATGDLSDVAIGAGLSLAGGTLTATGGANNWGLTGNTGTTPATNFIGTADNQPLAFRTNNTEKVRVTETGSVGIGTNAPGVKLQVVDTGDVAIRVGNAAGGRGHIQLGNDNHGLMRDLTSSGGLGNDVALFTSTGAGAAAVGSLYLVANPGSYGSDSLDLSQFVLKNTGNVGIGVADPKVKLQVQGGLLLRDDVNVPHGNGTFISWSTVRSGVGETEFVNFRGTGSGGFRFYDVDPGLSVDTAVYGTNDIAFIDIAGAYHVLSDMRVKTDVNGISNGLEKVMAMRPVSYDFHTGRTLKDGVVTFTAKDKAVKSMGFLAQELAKVVPEAVKVPKDANNELYAVTYTALIPVLTKAIQEQQAQIEALKAELANVKNENVALKADASKISELAERMKQLEAVLGTTTAGNTTASK